MSELVNCLGSISHLPQNAVFFLQMKMLGLLFGVFAVFAVIAFVSLCFFEPPNRQLFVGYLSVFSLISMFASPLFIIVSFHHEYSQFSSIFYRSDFLEFEHYDYDCTESGDQDKKCGVHAVLSVSRDILDESFFLCIWNA